MDTHEDSPGVAGLLYEFSFDDVLVGGGAFDAPVILEQNHIAKQLFPSEILEM